MTLNLKVKDKGEQTFFLQPFVSDFSTQKDIFILIRCLNEIDNPLLKLKLDRKNATFKAIFVTNIDESSAVLEEKLNCLALDTIEALQQGSDLSAENIPQDIEDLKPYDPDLIRVETTTMSLRQVSDMIKDGDINLSPDFQRNAIWDNQRKCRLIESILLRIPLPVFYFSADKTGALSVVDGLQRLTAIKEFMNNELVLKRLEYLNECEGCTYNDGNKIDGRYYRRFNLTQITTNIIESSSPTRVKYDIFRRLNTGGRPLNAQELRNCLSSPKLRFALKTMASSEEFLKATTKSISDDRMGAQEYALRFMYFRHLFLANNGSIEKYSGAMDCDLDEFVDKVSTSVSFDFDNYISDYRKAMINAEYLFGRNAFRKVNTENSGYRSVINKVLFISFSVLLADFDIRFIKQKCSKDSWVTLLGQLISKDEYLQSMLSYGTNGWKNIIYTFDEIRKMIKKHLINEDL